MAETKSEESIAFGHAVREARKALGLSQDDFAEVAELHRTYVGGIERGERNPTLASIWRIAKALGMSPENLIANTHSMLRGQR